MFIFIFVIVCIQNVLPNRARVYTTIITNFLISALLFADNLYYLYSSNVLSVLQISNLQYGEEILTTIPKLIQFKHIVYFIDIIIVLILICGFCLKGFKEKPFEQLFNIIVVAAVLQMFSNFDNVFTRLSDYYLQFLVLFIPMIFYEVTGKVQVNKNAAAPLLPFNQRSIRLLVMLLTVVLIWWYNTTCIGVNIANSTDDYTNYRFMWEESE